MGREGLMLFLQGLESAGKMGESLSKDAEKRKKMELISGILKEGEGTPQVPETPVGMKPFGGPATQSPFESQDFMGGMRQETPDVNQLRQMLAARDMVPTGLQLGNLGGQPLQQDDQMQGMQQPEDPINAMRAQADSLQKKALKVSLAGDVPTSNKLQNEANQLRQDIRAEQENRAKRYSADVKAKQDTVKLIMPIQAKALETQKSTNTVLNAFNNQLQLNATGKLGPASRANFSKFLKDKGFSDSIVNIFQSPEGALFNTQNKEIVSASLKTAFGAKPIGTEFEAFMDMLAKEGRVKEANELGIKSLMLPQQIDSEVATKTLQAIRENPEISPVQLQTLQYEFREEATNNLEADWEKEKERILQTSDPKNAATFFRKENSLQGNTPQGFTRMQNPKDGLYYDVPNSRLGR